MPTTTPRQNNLTALLFTRRPRSRRNKDNRKTGRSCDKRNWLFLCIFPFPSPRPPSGLFYLGHDISVDVIFGGRRWFISRRASEPTALPSTARRGFCVSKTKHGELLKKMILNFSWLSGDSAIPADSWPLVLFRFFCFLECLKSCLKSCKICLKSCFKKLQNSPWWIDRCFGNF